MEDKQKIFLVSGSGFLGRTLLDVLRGQGFPLTDSARRASLPSISLDLERPVAPQLEAQLVGKGFSWGIICAAETDVETCFRHPERSRRVNVGALAELLVLFRELGIKPVFFSSDLVFDGSGGFYDEEDPVSPTTLYGRQKAEAEELVRRSFQDHLIFRTSKLMSMDLRPRNILTPLVRALRERGELGAFVDQYITPVFVEEVALAVGAALSAGLSGTFHLAGRERLNRYELALMVARELGIEPQGIRPISLKDMRFSEPRGMNNTINAEKIYRALGVRFSPIAEGLKRMLENERS